MVPFHDSESILAVSVSGVSVTMESFARADTSRTMMSRQHSAADLARGLSHVLLDANEGKLPDDLEQLEDHMLII